MAPTRAWWWDSRFKQRDDAPPTYRRAPSTPIVSAGRCLFFLSPRMREGAERRVGASVTNWHLKEVPRAVVTRHARLPALHRGDFGPCHRVFFHRTGDLHLTLSRQHWRCPSSDVVKATEGGPLSGGGR